MDKFKKKKTKKKTLKSFLEILKDQRAERKKRES